MLTLNNIAINRDNRCIISNFSISFLPTAYICIYGPNGSGKTSILKVISLLLTASYGEILFNKISIKKNTSLIKSSISKDLEEEYRGMIYYMTDASILDEELTLINNLIFWAKIYNTTHSIYAVIKTFDLEKYIDIPIYKLSKGLIKKANLALLLLQYAPIWLLDEPFANLDDNGVKQLSDVISVKCDNGGIVIVTSPVNIDLKNCINVDIMNAK